MKHLLLNLSFLFLFPSLQAQERVGVFNIASIRTTENFHVIRAIDTQNTNDNFLIVSPKIPLIYKRASIEIGKNYYFELEFFVTEKEIGFPPPNRIREIFWTNKEKHLPYQTTNLDGLYYIEMPSKNRKN